MKSLRLRGNSGAASVRFTKSGGVDILDPTNTRLAIGLKAQKTHGASFSDGVNSGLNNIDNFSCLKFLSINISTP
jgi:hypothetical protein